MTVRQTDGRNAAIKEASSNVLWSACLLCSLHSLALTSSTRPPAHFCENCWLSWTLFFVWTIEIVGVSVELSRMDKTPTDLDPAPSTSSSAVEQEPPVLPAAPVTVVTRNGIRLVEKRVPRATLNQVLAHVFTFLDQESLGICRRVCRVMNEEACRSYSQREVTFGLSGKEFQDNYERREASEIFAEDGPSSWTLEMAQNLNLCLDYNTLRLRETCGWFDIIAPNLTMLEINGPFTASIVAKVLNKCPCLNALTLFNFNPIEEHPEESEGMLKLYCKQLPLNLKQLRFSSLDKSQQKSFTRSSSLGDGGSHLPLLVDLIKESPNLEHLYLHFELQKFIGIAVQQGLAPNHQLQELILQKEISVAELTALVNLFPKMRILQFHLSVKLARPLRLDDCKEYLFLKAAIRQLINLRQLETLRLELVTELNIHSLELNKSFEIMDQQSFPNLKSLIIVSRKRRSQPNQDMVIETILRSLCKPPKLAILELVNFNVCSAHPRVVSRIRTRLSRMRGRSGIDFRSK